MPRIARVVFPDIPYHVTQRGNYGGNVFDDDHDRRQYLQWLTQYAQKFETRIWAYCLMTNHVHFIAIPQTKSSLAQTFNATHMRYSHYFNTKHRRKGHLWQGRFFSCPLEDAYLMAALRYVERNPVRAAMVLKAGDYPWSSAKAHAERIPDALLSPGCPVLEEISNWSDFLASDDDKQWLQDLRLSTRTGRPLGSASFVLKIESKLGRTLKALPVGRPKVAVVG